MSQDCQIQLNQAIDIDDLAETFQRNGSGTISLFLTAESAERLHEHVTSRGDWTVQIKSYGDQLYFFGRADGYQWSPAAVAELRTLLAAETHDAFFYSYERIQLSDEKGEISEHGTIATDFASFLSSPTILELIRQIAGAAGIGSANSFRSRYRAGDYLTVHDDLTRRQQSSGLLCCRSRRRGGPTGAGSCFSIKPMTTSSPASRRNSTCSSCSPCRQNTVFQSWHHLRSCRARPSPAGSRQQPQRRLYQGNSVKHSSCAAACGSC